MQNLEGNEEIELDRQIEDFLYNVLIQVLAYFGVIRLASHLFQS
jgi:hypothetical protein